MADIGISVHAKIPVSLPWGDETLKFEVPDRIVFDGAMKYLPPVEDLEKRLLDNLRHPIGCEALGKMTAPGRKILILIEDNTRNTPLKRILPILIDYLRGHGIDSQDIELLTAPGTHRVMTDAEIIHKVGEKIVSSIKISQHDFRDTDSLVDLGTIEAGGNPIPIHVNKKAVAADFIIGLGNIIPHCDAGFSGGAKILQPGICGYATTAATHAAAALLDEIPLGSVENPCRLGMEKVARKVGLNFIVNTVMNHRNDILETVCGDFVAAHRKGAKISQKAFGVNIPEPADIVIASAYPCDMDYWQAEKGVISAYFTVKKGGYIIFVSPCHEGLAHNHPRFREWLKMSYSQACERIRSTSPEDETADLISADLAVCNARAREKAHILVVSRGLADADCKILGYKPFRTVQDAIDFALRKHPNSTIGILPRGGDCLPVLEG
jgi:nickel-dependent lactate racemase